MSSLYSFTIHEIDFLGETVEIVVDYYYKPFDIDICAIWLRRYEFRKFNKYGDYSPAQYMEQIKITDWLPNRIKNVIERLAWQHQHSQQESGRIYWPEAA